MKTVAFDSYTGKTSPEAFAFNETRLMVMGLNDRLREVGITNWRVSAAINLRDGKIESLELMPVRE